VTVPAFVYAATGTQVVVASVVTGAANPTYRWEQLTGSPVSVTGANTGTLTVSAPAARSDLSFRLTVTDAGTSLTADCALKVRRPTPASPLPLAAGRVFTYSVREEDYTWTAGVGPLHPSGPVPVGTLTMTVAAEPPVNGLPIFTLTFAESRTTAVPSCAAGQPDATSCGSPNFSCVSGTCVANKPFNTTATVLQADEQLMVWNGPTTATLQVINPNQVLPNGMAASFDGLELLSGQQRINPQLPETPVRFLGPTTLAVPGTAPAGSLAANGVMAPTIELYDGTRRVDVLSPYRTVRSHYVLGTGLVFFQHESVPADYAPLAKAGYRDAVLTGIVPAP
jgi:hypothetical protein